MVTIKDGGPAFPRQLPGIKVPIDEAIEVINRYAGMTLRDYFAGQALIGILGSRTGFLVDVGTDNAPGWAYRVADAMLKARESSHDN